VKTPPWIFLKKDEWPSFSEEEKEVIIRLSQEETQHAVGALRLRKGDDLTLFDGQGRKAEAVLLDEHRREAVCLLRFIENDMPPSPRIVIASAIPEGQRALWMIEKMSELGAYAFQPLLFQRSQGKGYFSESNAEKVEEKDALDTDVLEVKGALGKWKRKAIAAAKQCHRTWLLRIYPPKTFPLWTSERRERYDMRYTAYGSPFAAKSGVKWAQGTVSQKAITFVVGPEGGFLDVEEAQLREAGAEAVSLGPYILRVETAVVAASAIISSVFAGERE